MFELLILAACLGGLFLLGDLGGSRSTGGRRKASGTPWELWLILFLLVALYGAL